MNINTGNLVSITEANQNFSRVARMADENGAVVILKNNTPRYCLLNSVLLKKNRQLPMKMFLQYPDGCSPKTVKLTRNWPNDYFFKETDFITAHTNSGRNRRQ